MAREWNQPEIREKKKATTPVVTYAEPIPWWRIPGRFEGWGKEGEIMKAMWDREYEAAKKKEQDAKPTR